MALLNLTESDDEKKGWEDKLAASLPREGEKVRLRVWTAIDIDRCSELDQPGAPQRATNGPNHPKKTAEEVEAWRLRLREKVGPGRNTGRGHRVVVADRDTDAFVGSVTWGFEQPHNEPLNHLEVGVNIMDHTRWGQGLGTEALRMWVDLLFELRGCYRIGMATWSGHHAMRAVAAKLGFREEGRRRECVLVDGQRYDTIFFGLLGSEWAARFSKRVPTSER